MEYYRIGKIVNTFGIRGEVKVISDTDFPEDRFKSGSVLTILGPDQKTTSVTVSHSRLHKGSYIVGFSEFQSINEVETFKNSWLAVTEDQQTELEEGSYYYHQIVGLEVQTDSGQLLGKIKDILALGSNDVWVIDPTHSGKRDILIPYIDDVVQEVNLAKGIVIITPIEGLIDDED